MAAQWPLILNGLLGLYPTLPGWSSVTVLDGPTSGDTYAPTRIVVGWGAAGSAGSYAQSEASDGWRWQETGSIVSQLTCETGQVNVNAAMRSQAFTLTDAFEAFARDDRTLDGLLPPESTVSTSVDVVPLLNQQGSACVLDLTINYLTIT